MLDVKRLISEVASRNGIRLDEDDPAFCLVTINQIVLEETAAKIVEDVRTATREFEQAAERLHRRSGVVIAEQIKDSLATLRPLSVPDRAKVSVAIPSDRIRWFAVGLLSGLVMFVAGILVGISFR